jgi:hypothetical protein
MSYLALNGDPCDDDPDPEFCRLLARKEAEFAAAKAEGLTPEQWYKKRGITPAGKPIAKTPELLLWGSAFAVVTFLILRKKQP